MGYNYLHLQKPDNNLVWAILSTIFCCMPFGIVAIIYAARVDSEWAQGLHQQAIDSSSKAKKWSIISLVSALIFIALYILFYVIFFIFLMHSMI